MSQKKAQILNPLSGNINVAGVITASSFVGSGEGLTGVASTDNIQTATEATFLSGVKITGVTTASGGVVGNLTGNVTGNATGLSGTPNITVGAVNASSGTISGNLSVGGTLTYQDVTNIDSIGIITAQQGIQVLANGLDVTGFSTFKTGVSVTGVVTATSFSGNVTGNLTGDVNAATFDTGVGGVVVTGVATATSFTGDGSNLTGTNRTASLVASGTLSNGQTVIIQTDGTVTGIASTSQSLGSAVVFESANLHYSTATFDSSNNKVVIAYGDIGNSYYGTAVVGTVTGTGITFGTPVVFETGNTEYSSAVYDSTNGKVVIAYRDGGNSDYGTAVVGTVSGDTISFGTPVIFESAAARWEDAAYDSTNGKVVIAYRDEGNSNYGTAIVGTVSGTSISFGTPVVFESADTRECAVVYDSSNEKIVIAYSDYTNSQHGTAIVGTVSGTSISFGSATVFESAVSEFISATYDSTNGKVVVAYQDGGNSSAGTAIVGTVSGTSISFGSAVVFESSNAFLPEVVYDSNAGKVVIAYKGTSNYGHVIVGTVSGTSISFGSAVVFESAATDTISSTFDSTNNKVVIAYRDEGNSNYGTSIVFRNESTNLTSENFIGFSDAAYSDGDTAKIQVVTAIDDAQSGLTTGSKHYVQTDGTLSTTAGSPSVLAGTAISDTEIIVKQ
jgi:hypothetical protein